MSPRPTRGCRAIKNTGTK